MSTQYVLVHQPPNEDNPTYFGPFDSLAEVSAFAERHQLDHEEWHIPTLVNPLKPERSRCADYTNQIADTLDDCAWCSRAPWEHDRYHGLPWPPLVIRTWRTAHLITPERADELKAVTR